MQCNVGVDGCRGGWFAVTDIPGSACQVFSRLQELLDAYPGASRVFIDIPLGLCDDAERQPEHLARKVLGRRSSSVFPVPCRAAVYAEDYLTACDVNARATGKRISKQAWNICNKIREADQVTDTRLLETHPEIAFLALAGEPLQYSKKTPDGIAERLALLPETAHAIYERAMLAYARSVLARDDVLDALALLACAGMTQTTLPAIPDVDSRGRAMAITVPLRVLG